MARLAGQTDPPFPDYSGKKKIEYNEWLSLPPKPPEVPSGGSESLKEYAERVGKYVPAEIVAAYTAINGVLAGVDPHDPAKLVASITVFVLCLICTPLYLNALSKPKQPKRIQLWVSSIAFLVWAYALGGVFADVGRATNTELYKPWLGSLLLICFSLVSGTINPTGNTDR